MARQAGANQFRGKRQGFSGYAVKNKEGLFVRSINPNMSERVKTESNYALTRQYATRFQMINWMKANAASSIDMISRGRRTNGISVKFLKNPAELNKRLYSYLEGVLESDTTAVVGNQHFLGTDWQDNYRDIINRSSQNLDYLGLISLFSVSYKEPTTTTTGGGKINLTIGTTLISAFKALGYNYLIVNVQHVGNKISNGLTDRGEYRYYPNQRTLYSAEVDISSISTYIINNQIYSLGRREVLYTDGDDSVGSAMLRITGAIRRGTQTTLSQTSVYYRCIPLTIET